MFKDKFVEMIQKSGKTAKEIALATGIQESSISDYKKGINQPTVNNLIKLSEYFNCSIDYLLDREKINGNTYIANQGEVQGNNTQNINSKDKDLSYLEMELVQEIKKLSKAEQIQLLATLNKE